MYKFKHHLEGKQRTDASPSTHENINKLSRPNKVNKKLLCGWLTWKQF